MQEAVAEQSLAMLVQQGLDILSHALLLIRSYLALVSFVDFKQAVLVTGYVSRPCREEIEESGEWGSASAYEAGPHYGCQVSSLGSHSKLICHYHHHEKAVIGLSNVNWRW